MLKKMIFMCMVLCGCFLLGCSQQHITITCYNIAHGRGTDNKLDMQRIAGVIRETGADIVVLNEVDNNFSARSDFLNQAAELAGQLGMDYAFGPGIVRGDAENPNLYGNAILSVYPIISSMNHKLPGQGEPRAALAVKLDIDGRQLAVLATHLQHNSEADRMAQVEKIMALITEIDMPVILAGDFNAIPDSQPIAMVLKQMQDTEQLIYGKMEMPTFPGRRPRKIDYIFVSNDLANRVKTYNVINNEITAVASDHFPITAKIKF